MSSTALFERRMATAGLALGPVLALAVYWWNPASQSPEAQRLLAIITLAIVYWMSESIPLPATALLASALVVVTGTAPAREVFAPYADPVIFLIIGSFLLAEAFRTYGLDKRIAAAMLHSRMVGKSGGGVTSGFAVASASMSSFLSNTATAALLTPVAIGAVRESLGEESEAPEEPRDVPGWASGLVLTVAYCSSIGGLATLIGTPPNLLAAGFLERMTGTRISFASWLTFGVPIALVLLPVAVFWVRTVLGTPPRAQLEPAIIRPGAEPASQRAGRRWTLVAFALAATLWMVPGLAGAALGADAPVTRTLVRLFPEAGVALLAASLLFLAPVNWKDRKFALTWEQGRRLNWGIVILFGGGLSLGTLAADLGIAQWLGMEISQIGIASTPAGLLAVSIAASILLSEFASNTASATLIIPIIIAAAQASGLDPVAPAIGAGIAATSGFIFPVSTPPNAIAFGTGLVPLWRMIKVGVLMDLSSFVVIWLGLLALGPVLPH